MGLNFCFLKVVAKNENEIIICFIIVLITKSNGWRSHHLFFVKVKKVFGLVAINGELSRCRQVGKSGVVRWLLLQMWQMQKQNKRNICLFCSSERLANINLHCPTVFVFSPFTISVMFNVATLGC
jgi:hypothetical protein